MSSFLPVSATTKCTPLQMHHLHTLVHVLVVNVHCCSCSRVYQCSRLCPHLKRQLSVAISTLMPSRTSWCLSFTADMVRHLHHCVHLKVSYHFNSHLYPGIIKTHNLGFQECEALEAVFNKDLCPNHIIGSAKLVSARFM